MIKGGKVMVTEGKKETGNREVTEVGQHKKSPKRELRAVSDGESESAGVRT